MNISGELLLRTYCKSHRLILPRGTALYWRLWQCEYLILIPDRIVYTGKWLHARCELLVDGASKIVADGLYKTRSNLFVCDVGLFTLPPAQLINAWMWHFLPKSRELMMHFVSLAANVLGNLVSYKNNSPFKKKKLSWSPFESETEIGKNHNKSSTKRRDPQLTNPEPWCHSHPGTGNKCDGHQCQVAWLTRHHTSSSLLLFALACRCYYECQRSLL